MNETWTAGLSFALDVALKATLVFSITALAVAALKQSGAAARHFVGTAGLIGALALPLLSLVLPRVELPLLKPLIPAPRAEAPTAKANGWTKAPAAGLAPRLREDLAMQNAKTWEPRSASAPEKMNAAVESTPSSPARVPWVPLVLAAWAAGTLLVGARLTVGLTRVRGIRRTANPLEDRDWREETDHLADRLGVRRSVGLFESERVPVAITSGLLRPILLLCRQARQWAIERRRVVLLHELAHVKRADWIWLLFAEAVLAVYWWHPLAWVLARQVRRDGEKACDDLVLEAGTKPSVYAGHLLGIFRSLSTAAHPVAPAVASARPSHFEGRLRAILDPSGPRRDLPRARAAACAAGLIFAASGIAVISPWASPCSHAAVLGPSGDMVEPHAKKSVSEWAMRTTSKISTATTTSTASTSTAAKPKTPCHGAKAPEKPGQAAPAAAPAVRAEAWPAATPEAPAPAAMFLPAAAAPEAAEEPETPLPESGRTVPAILKALESVKAPTAGFVRASKGFTKASQKSGADWYSRGMSLHNDERYDEAISAFEKAIEAGYREDAASYNIACGYALKGDRDKAFEWLRKAMDAGFEVSGYLDRDDDLDNLKSDPRWKEFKKTARAHPSSRHEREGSAAAARYERISAKAPKDGEPYYNAAHDLYKAERYELAAKAYGDAAARGYRAGTALYNQACSLSLAGHTDAALDALKKSLDAGFDQPDLFAKDDDLDNVRDDPRFEAIAREAKDLSLPGYGTGWMLRSSERRAKWRNAAKQFEDYTRAHPQSGRAWFNLGFAQLAGERPEAAVEAFTRALNLNYRTPTTMYNLACSYARMDQRDPAFEWLFKALDAGFDATGTLRGDEDLDNLRGDPRFRRALDIAKARDKSKDD